MIILGSCSTRLNSGLFFLRALLALVMAFSLSGCGDIYRYLKSGEVGWALKKELRDRNAKKVEIAALTKFEWDEFFVFGAYEPTNEVCKFLKFSEAECKSTITVETDNDGEALMVFRLKGRIVHVEKHLGFHGYFKSASVGPFTRGTAVFSVSVEDKTVGGDDWLVLRPISEVYK
jgi:hypothetical protein